MNNCAIKLKNHVSKEVKIVAPQIASNFVSTANVGLGSDYIEVKFESREVGDSQQYPLQAANELAKQIKSAYPELSKNIDIRNSTIKNAKILKVIFPDKIAEKIVDRLDKTQQEQDEIIAEESKPKVKTGIKPGVEELFDSNPELANQVYEALGFKQELFSKEDVIKLYDDEFTDFTVLSQEPFLKELTPTTYRGGEAYTIGENTYTRIKDESSILEAYDKGEIKKEDINKALENAPYKYKRNNQRITQEEFDTNRVIGTSVLIQYNNSKSTFIVTNEGELIEGKKRIKAVINQITQQQKQQALQLYSQYLDTIFPDSKVKDIVYHGTEDKFDKFDIKFFGKNDYGDLGKGFYFAFNKESIFNEPIVISAIVDDTNSRQNPGYEIMIPNAEQIHILGNKQDIEGFKKFAQTKSAAPLINPGVQEQILSPEMEQIIKNNHPQLQDGMTQLELNFINRMPNKEC